MLLPIQQSLYERVQAITQQVLNTNISPQHDLIETGLMDSLALVSLLLELETQFSLSLIVDDLEIDHFRTLESITAFIQESQLVS